MTFHSEIPKTRRSDHRNTWLFRKKKYSHKHYQQSKLKWLGLTAFFFPRFILWSKKINKNIFYFFLIISCTAAVHGIIATPPEDPPSGMVFITQPYDFSMPHSMFPLVKINRKPSGFFHMLSAEVTDHTFKLLGKITLRNSTAVSFR